MDLIKLPYQIGIPIVNYLKEIGIEPRQRNGIYSFEFTQEELDKVLELEIDYPSPGCLKWLERCRNLKSLSIVNKAYSAYDNGNMSISDEDIKVISKLVSLESLTIIGQKNITWVDVTDLVNLKSLTIERNNSIDVIEGLESLKNIKEVSIFGNKELYEIPSIVKLIAENKLDVLYLDLLNYPEVSGLMSQLLAIPNCMFCETCTNRSDISYSCSNAYFFHEKCLKIIDEIKSHNPSNKVDLIILLEKYIAEHITYDDDGLKSKGRYHAVDGVNKGRKFGTQSAYNGLMFGSCVCEGYTRSMQYLLKMMGIKTKNVYCIEGKDRLKINKYNGNRVELPEDGYHSIIRVDFNNMIYYCDPCWDSCYWHGGDKTLPYCLKNRDDMCEDHTLSFEEDGISGPYSIDPEYIKSYVKKIQEAEHSETVTML